MQFSDYFTISPASPSGLIWNTRPREHFNRDASWRHFNNQKASKSAGYQSSDTHGYLAWKVELDSKVYVVARIIWVLLHGEIPSSVIVEHKNNDALDNSHDNLRLASRSQNKMNESLRKDNRSGFKGVTKRGKKWAARIGCGGSTVLGTFDTPEDAHAAYCAAAQDRYGNFYSDGVSSRLVIRN